MAVWKSILSGPRPPQAVTRNQCVLRSQLKSNVRIKGGSFIVVSDHNATVPTMRLVVSGLILQFVRMGRYHGVFPDKGMKALNFPIEGRETSDYSDDHIGVNT